MTVLTRTLCAALALVAFCVTGTEALRAQNEATTLQQEAERKFSELHERMQKLQLLKAESEPDAAATLDAGNRFIQERELRQAMSEVRSLLGDERYDEALAQMDAVTKDLQRLLDLLLDRNLDLQDLLDEIKRLEEYKDRVEELLTEQQDHKDRSAEAEALEKHLQELEEAKDAVQQLIDDQDKLRDAANKAGLQAAENAAKEMSEAEGDLKQRTEDLEPKLRKLERDAEKLAEKKGEAKDGAPKDGKPSDPKSGEPKDGESKDGKPGEGKCSGACQGASKSMGQAQEKLQKNQPERSLEDMDRAKAKLQESLNELEKLSEDAKRRLMQLPYDQQSKAQERTKVSTDKLAQDMESDDKKGDSEGKPQQTPGKRNVQQAVPKQKAAAGQLKEYKPGEAKQDQQDALDQLEKAKKELEDALAQLRQELQDEVLRALEERFAEMLERQKVLGERTKAADRLAEQSVTAEGTVPRAVADRALEIGAGERELAGEAHDALKLLEEDGSTAGFPEVVGILRDDLNSVADRLERAKVAAVTQAMQAEIEQTLKDLIDALRRTIEQKEGGGQPCQCNGQPVLVPRSAELKLVMIKQKRVNSRTKAYDEEVPEQLRVTDEARDAAGELARQQGKVEDLLRKIATQIQKDEQAAGGN